MGKGEDGGRAWFWEGALTNLFAAAPYRGDCPHCGRWVSRRSGDTYTTCQRCGWSEGLVGLRLLTHWPNWYYWRRFLRRWTKRTVVFLVVVVAVLLLTNSLSVGADKQGDFGPVNISVDLSNFPDAPRDSDGDGLWDDDERGGETSGGYVLTNADPERMDLYLHLYLTGGVPDLSAAERAELRENWAEMPVENTDNSTGIRLHITTHRVDERFVSDFSRRDLRERAAEMYEAEVGGTSRECVAYVGVLATSDGPGRELAAAGRAYSPGYLFIGDGSAEYRTDVITHELLHNVVGQFEDGDGHTNEGWLAASGSDRYLSDQTAGKLNADGFEEPQGDAPMTC